MARLRIFLHMRPIRKSYLLRVILVLGTFLGLYLYISQFQDALIDDAYITFQYARNLHDHHNWGIFPGTTTNTATSPLNIILTAGANIIFKDVVVAGLWLATVEATILLVVLVLISKRMFNHFYFGIAGFLVTMLNPFVVSSLGLETMLYLMLICVNVYLFYSKRWNWLAVTLGALTLTRADGVLLFLIMGGYIMINTTASRVNKILFVCIYLICLAPWYVFSWLSLGSLIPDTFFLKFNQSWKGFSYLSGWSLYLFRYPMETMFSFILTPIGVLYVLRNRKKVPIPVMLFCLFGCLYFGAYSTLRVPPYHWYYTPVAFNINLTGVYAILAALQGRGKKQQKERMNVIYLAGVIVYLSVGLCLAGIGKQSILESPIHTNYATASEYREIGVWLEQHIGESKRIKLAGEIGTMAFYSHRQLIDMFSCRYEMQLRINRLNQRGGWIEKLARLNFAWFEPGDPCWPQDYLLGYVQSATAIGDVGNRVIQTWPVTTRWVSDGQIVLWELRNNSSPPDVLP